MGVALTRKTKNKATLGEKPRVAFCVVEIIDSTGDSVVKYTYNAWGEAMVSGTDISLGVINPYRYRGYYYDSGSGLYFLQTRYYDPQVGRFLSMDDVEYIDPETIGGVNLFAYCNNNPVMNVDPSGHFIITSLLIGLGVGAAVGFGGTMVADYVDDGEIFNGSMGWEQYLGNTLLGAGVGAVIGLGGHAILGGLASVGKSLAVDAIASLVTGNNQFGSIQDYAASFILGGVTKYLGGKFNKYKNRIDMASNILAEPFAGHMVGVAVNGETFSSVEIGSHMVINLASHIFKNDFGRELFQGVVMKELTRIFGW